MDFYFLKNDQILCCVCFNNVGYALASALNSVYNLSDIPITLFHDSTLPDNLVVKSACNLHYICIGCMRTILGNYENHPINENNSLFACPFPFNDCVTSIGFKCVFDHNTLKKVFKTVSEYNRYLAHAEEFAFPGYTVIKCPMMALGTPCNYPILVLNEQIKNTNIGDLVVSCDQNRYCLKTFCYNCKESLPYHQTVCFVCKTSYENENPNVYNYFLTKTDDLSPDKLSYDETDYLYLNKDITIDIATKQILDLLKDVNTYMICAVCKISLYKTERCNGLSHHNVERCYACGRIGYKIKGLVDHWDSKGHGGCFRFDHDAFVYNSVPNYKCKESVCHSHEKGDCNLLEHQQGIIDLATVIKKAYVWNILKSLLPNIRYQVYDTLYLHGCTKYLPYKQSLFIVQYYKRHYSDYTENIVYQRLSLQSPQEVGFDKMYTLHPEEYIKNHSCSSSSSSLIQSTENLNFTLSDNDSDDSSIDIEAQTQLPINSQTPLMEHFLDTHEMIYHAITNDDTEST
ncbi:hypothetical protein EB118_16460 [bacterium]|nr:hypothetical protein [bacterium]NDG31647.1 hypothetical protein [bacterium]